MNKLTERQIEIIRNMIDFIDNENVGADELVGCTMDEWNELEEALK